MKNKILILILALLLVALVLAFSSCSQKSTDTNTDASTDTDTATKYIIESADGFTIDTRGQMVTLYRDISNETENIDLSKAITVSKNCTWKLYKDFEGNNELKLKSLSLSIGLNKAYIIVYHPNGEDFTRYEVNLYRLDMKDYSFVAEGALFSNGTTEEKSSINAPAELPQKVGCAFDGWTVNGELVKFPYQVNEETTFSASWTPIQYEIKYELNGGENNEENPNSYNVEQSLVLKAPTRVGYTFAGWFSDEQLENEVTEIHLGTIESKTFYAKWTPNNNTLVFDANSGSGSMSDMTIASDASANLTTNAFTKDGYTLVGWSTTKDGEVEYADGAEYKMGTNATYTLYAVWTKNINGLIFNGNGATSGSMSSVEIATENTALIPNNSFIKNGYTFVGWSTTENGSVEYADGASYTMGTNATYILYAVWEANNNTLVFNANGGSGSMSDMTIATDASANLTTNAFTRKGYTFVGWSTTKDGEVEYVDGASYTMGTNSSYTLYAVWEANEYTITYNKNGGTEKAENPVKFTIEDLPITLNDLSKANYLFNYWYKERDFSGSPVLQIVDIGDVELYAEYVECTDGISLTDAKGEWTVSAYTGTATDVVIPKSYKGKNVTSIGNYAFDNCTSLASITIPDSVTLIGEDAFDWCPSLASVNYLGEVEQWCNISLNGFKANPLYNGAKLYLNGTLVTDLVIPDTVTKIKDYAFVGCTSLTSITIPDSVTSIEVCAFAGCTSLTSVTIPDSVTTIGGSAFADCDSLTSVTIGNGVTTIGSSAFENCDSLTSVTIPDSVTTIGDYAFADCDSLTSVTIPDSVTIIGSYAFAYCYSLASITIPDSVTTIGSWAFYNCDSLTSITIPSSVTSIGNDAFARCYSLTSIVIPDSVTEIGEGAFSGCSSLTSVTIPDSVTTIGDSAFYNCPIENATIPTTAISSIPKAKLKTVVINGGTSIEKGAFYGCSSLTSITIGNGVTTIGSSAFYNCKSLTSVTIENGVTSIGERAFYSCSSLTSVTIPDSVTSIGERTFDGCTSLTNVTIPNSVTTIGNSAFKYCSSLTSVTIPDSVTSIENGAFVGCTSLTSITIPDSITSIGESALYGCSSLTSVTIPDSVTSIGERAFDGCYKLVEVYNLSSLNITKGSNSYGYVGNYAKIIHTSLDEPSIIKITSDGYVFAYVSNNEIYLVDYQGNETELTLPESYNGNKYKINQYAFTWRDDITKITIPDSVTTIGNNAFENCDSLTSVTIPDSVTTIGDSAFYNCPIENATIPTTAISSIPKTKLKTVVINGGTSIEKRAFDGCDSLTSITIPSSVTTIGERAFAYCDSLTSVTIPDSVTTIENNAFDNCDSLTSITIPSSVTSIGEGAFDFCYSLKSVNYLGEVEQWCNISFGSVLANPLYNGAKLYLNGTLVTDLVIPDTVTKIKDYAFAGCDSLTSITIPDSVTSIGYSAFDYCTSLTSITIPNSVTSIGEDAFDWCYSLTSVNYLGEVEQWCNISFGNDFANPLYNDETKLYLNGTLVTDLVIPDTVTKIKDYAFAGCDSLTSVTIPSSVTEVGEGAFISCTSLASITIPDSVTTIGDYALYNCDLLTSITIPSSVTTIGSYAFADCYSLTSVTIPSSVISIGSNAFVGCTSLKCNEYDNAYYLGNDTEPYLVLIKAKNTSISSCIINESTKTVCSSAFSGCTSLTSITIPDSVTTIGDSAFYDCDSLTSVTIPDSVTSIGERAFAYCDSLTSITIPSSVTSIGEDAFYNCKSLTIYCEAESQPNGWDSDWNYSSRPVEWGYKQS